MKCDSTTYWKVWKGIFDFLRRKIIGNACRIENMIPYIPLFVIYAIVSIRLCYPCNALLLTIKTTCVKVTQTSLNFGDRSAGLLQLIYRPMMSVWFGQRYFHACYATGYKQLKPAPVLETSSEDPGAIELLASLSHFAQNYVNIYRYHKARNICSRKVTTK